MWQAHHPLKGAVLPSPVAHTAVGYAIHQVLCQPSDEDGPDEVGRLPSSLVAVIAISLLPDLDSALGIALGDLARYHNNVTHSFIVGLGVASAIGGAVGLRRRSSVAHWFLISLLAYASHMVMDFLTAGRGVMAFWPLTSHRYLSPVTLFYGLRWSDGVVSVRHTVTLVTELAFSLGIALATGARPYLRKHGASPWRR
jgi:membrane-bound metal-dependent hydrolase YbcI (DUF457 family)